jgi:hypothetical protein
LTGVGFGLVPAMQGTSVGLNGGLRDAFCTLDPRRSRAKRLLIVSELALSLVLLAGFGLLIRSWRQSGHIAWPPAR